MNYPFTSYDDVDSMTILQAQRRAEEETDDLTYLRMENDMAAKKLTKAPAEKKPFKAPTKKAATAKPAAAEKKASKAGAKPRITPEGFVGLKELSAEFKTTPMVIRRKLRNSDLTKPEDGGWVFKDGSKDLAAVRKLLTPAAKAE